MGLQYGKSPGSIQVEGSGNNLFFDSETAATIQNNRPVGLYVPIGHTLAMLGGNITLTGGNLTAEDGRIVLASLAPDESIALISGPLGWAFELSDTPKLQDIVLADASSADTSGVGVGRIEVWGRTIRLQDGSSFLMNVLESTSEENGGVSESEFPAVILAGDFEELSRGRIDVTASESLEVVRTSENVSFGSSLLAETSNSRRGGDIRIVTPVLLLEDGGQVSTTSFASGRAGNVKIQVSEFMHLDGSLSDPTAPRVATGIGSSARGFVDSVARGGQITIDTGELLIEDGAAIASSTVTKGSAGDININVAGSVTVQDGGQMFNSSFGEGDGGNILINADEEVWIRRFFREGLVATAIASQTSQSGNGGSLTINTDRLFLEEGAFLSAGTFGTGDAGEIIVNASQLVEFSGTTGLLDVPSNQPLAGADGAEFAGGIASDVFGDGRGGDVTVNTPRLTVRDGAQITVSTVGTGNAGTIIINAPEFVDLSGMAESGLLNSGILARSGQVAAIANPEATGTGGSIQMNTGTLRIQDGASMSLSGTGLGEAGGLKVAADSIYLNQGSIDAQTNSAFGGSLRLRSNDLTILRNNSQISATAGITQGGGSGGNITIRSPFIIGVLGENSDITANAFTGRGGNVIINAVDILGLEFQEQLTPESDITASSEFGTTGVVQLNTPDVDPLQGVDELPTALLDVSQLVQQDLCRQGQGSAFVISGRGGSAASPNAVLRPDVVWDDLRLPGETMPMANVHTESGQNVLPTPLQGIEERILPHAHSRSRPIVEAQGWSVIPTGQIVLTTQGSIVTPHGLPIQPLNCQ